jgi:hypothetical protein
MDIKTLCDKYSLNRIVLLVYFYVLVLDEPLDQMVYPRNFDRSSYRNNLNTF